jgi:hypothetical protein
MAAYVFVRKDAAIPRLKELREAASRQAEGFGLNEQERWWNYRGDDIVFGFAMGAAGLRAAHFFHIYCTTQGIQCRVEW